MAINFTSIDLTHIICAIIALLCSIVVRYFIPLMKEKTSEKTCQIIEYACNSAVYFAEQWYKCDDGEKKKEEALKHAEAYLKERNITIDVDLLSDCIEAEVKKLKLAIKAVNG